MWNAVALRARPRAQMGEHPARPLRDANGARAALPPAHRTGTRMGLPRGEIIAAERLPRRDVGTSGPEETGAGDSAGRHVSVGATCQQEKAALPAIQQEARRCEKTYWRVRRSAWLVP